MATTPVTPTNVDELNQMIDDGVRQVTIGDQTTTMNTTDSLIRARNDAMERQNRAKAREAGRRRSGITKLVYGGRGY